MSECLVRLRVTHEWYGNHHMDGVAPYPDPQTAALLRRHDLWTRFDGTEWTLYTGRAGNAATVMAGLARALDGGALRLLFAGDMTHLAAITALPPGLRTLPHFTSRAFDADPVIGPGGRRLTPRSDAAAAPGTIWLFPDDLAQAPPGTTWSIRFKALALPWMFYVVNRGRNQLHQPFVRSSDGRMLDGPVATRLPDGDAALRFDSGDQSLAFSKAPTLRFGLFDRLQSPLSDRVTEVCLIRSLPLPSAGSILWAGDGLDRRIGAAAAVYL